MSTYLDYIGRTVDVSVFRSAVVNGDLSMSLFGDDGGQVCAGIQKLAQRWLMEFGTDVGSMPYEPNRGGNFFRLASSGQLLTELDVYQAFNLDADNHRRYLINEETDDDPDDEKFLDAELTGIALSPGVMSLQVTLTSRAGLSRPILLPIPLAI